MCVVVWPSEVCVEKSLSRTLTERAKTLSDLVSCWWLEINKVLILTREPFINRSGSDLLVNTPSNPELCYPSYQQQTALLLH